MLNALLILESGGLTKFGQNLGLSRLKEVQDSLDAARNGTPRSARAR